ncbi:MAG: PEP-CTERM sorting domain-containing protein [Desulfobacterales bacterium]|jgi:hypothetical protein|nr:PEP-CTERM sorting domain-containing protein [Desulfobacterales bacterium]
MNRIRVVAVVILSFLLLSTSTAFATWYSTFDTNAEGWEAFFGINKPTEEPDLCSGSICITSNTSTAFFINENWKNWSGYYGGAIEFDIKVTGESDPKIESFPLVLLNLPGESNSFAEGTDFTVSQKGEWVHYKIDILNSNFYVTDQAGGGTLQERLSDIEGILIRADLLRNSSLETTCIDNVRVSPVPEPATMVLLGAGLLGIVGCSRKKFKNN